MNHEEILLTKLKSKYTDLFGSLPSVPILTCAPGRVNLIGEHVDYNDGFVLPMAISFKTFIFGFNIAIVSSVPMGSGLSSSAALEVAFYTFLEKLTNSRAPTLVDKALQCQKAENVYAGVPCGNMDQLISVLGKEDFAILIDCKSLEIKYTPLKNPEVVIMIINSHVKHELQGSEYSQRRASCEKVARLLQVSSLREVCMEDLEKIRTELTEDEFRKGRHVITEIQRTILAHTALEKDDYDGLGQLFYESHESLKNDFEVSCHELDFLVDSIKPMEGVYGSRMTGGGFGGCTVSIIKRSHAEEIQKEITHKYKQFHHKEITVFTCKPSQGARIIE
ncbi:galK [Lepeophtheirus salmonis]|uniref:GalK n=1 Tax=Lepeophtheirus salmonis TaxID=72036 RepID=A0A7R8CXB7_LEPSM|nr:galK [Lepeophtheirus salmonis]CAF2959234.1 galK [Lepeophtheirus salmonis]